MFQHSKDPILNVIHGQIKQSIKICIENECWDAAVKLIYSGIDTMAFLGMPAKQLDVTRDDFVTWVERYIQFSSGEQLTGLDVYGARCSMLHTHSIYSRLYREGKCRLIGYADKMDPPVAFNPQVTEKLVVVSIPALAKAFFEGVDKSLIDLFSDPEKAGIAEGRLKELVHYLPARDTGKEP